MIKRSTRSAEAWQTMGAASIVVVVVFVVAGAGYLLRLAKGRGAAGRVGDGLHVAMSLAMVWMIVAPPSAVILLIEGVFFLAATAFYVVLLRLRHHPRQAPSTHHSGGLRLGFHVTMMATMVAMAGVAMVARGPDPGSGQGPVSASASGHSAHAGMGMSPVAGADGLGLDPAALLVVFFGGATLWYAAVLLRAARRGRVGATDPALLMLMSAGTALAFASV